MKYAVVLIAAVGVGLILVAALARVPVHPQRAPTRGEREAEEVIKRAWSRF